MPNDLVRWNDFYFIFSIKFPKLTAKVKSGKYRGQPPPMVLFFGQFFEIRKRPGAIPDFDIYGPAIIPANLQRVNG
jgi:hypothetical protein